MLQHETNDSGLGKKIFFPLFYGDARKIDNSEGYAKNFSKCICFLLSAVL